MAEPSPVFVYGPFGFVAVSCLLSLLITPWTTRLVRRVRKRRRRKPEREELRAMFRAGPRPNLDRLYGLLLAVVLLWSSSSALASSLLLLESDERDGRLPGDHVDALVLAHVVPPLSNLAARGIVARLEHGGSATRWQPPGALEERLVFAARLDPNPDDGVERLIRHGYRTRAARFATAHPSPRACEAGQIAAAEALRGGLLFELMMACRNIRGDASGHAAFKMGDFLRAVGPEAESIISRVTRTPQSEPSCVAGGYDVPAEELPLCRLIHGEVHASLRRQLLSDLSPEPRYARLWAAAARADLGEPFAQSALWSIDPEQLVLRPFDAVIDQPIAIYQEIRVGTSANLTPGQSAWVRLAIAAERSALGRHADASRLVDEAFSELEIGAGASEAERAATHRLAAAIALRADDAERLEQAFEDLAEEDPLRALAATLAKPQPALSSDALEADASAIVKSPIELRRAGESARPALREWIRERFPACVGCGFFRELRFLAARREAALALVDEELAAELEPIVARFEAVLLNRTLAISLRAADPASASDDAAAP